jgi:L-lactate dehydrogenase complex protein LldE
MKVGLFIPCYVDQFYPDVGMATVELLENLGIEVDFPTEQTCCGQPMANTGCTEQTRPLAEKYFRIFRDYEYVVCPSGSCVSMVRNHYVEYLNNRKDFEQTCARTMELCEFLTDVMKIESLAVKFPYRVGLHSSCHGLRELRLDKCSERRGIQVSKVRRLLEMVEGIEFVKLQREDECCGFGGTFAVAEEGVSVLMGRDRCEDHIQAGAQVIAATDMSCLMHMEGILRRQKNTIPVMHVAQVLMGRQPQIIR